MGVGDPHDQPPLRCHLLIPHPISLAIAELRVPCTSIDFNDHTLRTKDDIASPNEAVTRKQVYLRLGFRKL